MATTEQTIAEFTEAIANRNPKWREGQAAFNHLHKVAPGWADHIRGGPLDPFHIDERLPAFFGWLPSIVAAEGDG